jgi:S1-C subfamily serine protease
MAKRQRRDRGDFAEVAHLFERRSQNPVRPAVLGVAPPGPPRGATMKLFAMTLVAVLPAFAPAAQGTMAWNMGLQGGDGTITIGGKEIPVGGDIILSVDGIPVVSEDNIEKTRSRLAALAPGAEFKMSVLRAGKVIELTGTSQ